MIFDSQVRLIHGDCLKILPTLEAGSIDAIVTDPPYGTDVPRDGYGRRQNGARHIANDGDLSCLDGVLLEANRLLTKNAWLGVFCSPKKHAEAAALLASRGFPVAGEVIWDKAAPGLGGGIRYQHETILLCKKGNVSGRSSMFSVLRHFVSRKNRQNRHPHEKPTPLMAELIRYCSEDGQVILDPFAGSGSTLVAAMKTGRRAIGIELDDRYIPVIKQRIEGARTPLFSEG